jgi:hypothetical protein
MGSSILIASASSLIVLAASNYQKKRIAIVVIATLFALLIAFNITVQHDNQKTWQYQQAFWSDVVRLAPDLNQGTVILVDAPHLYLERGLHPFSWTMPAILGQLFRFPEHWKILPKVYWLNPNNPDNWRNQISTNGHLKLDSSSTDNNGLLFYYYAWEPKRTVNVSDVILLREKDRQLMRQTDPISVGGREFKFKLLAPDVQNSFRKGFLYEYLIDKSSSNSIDYFRK